jgi:rhodanese-related sulfurtransferase
VTVALLALVTVTACAGAGPATIDTSGAVVVDVRTPAEFAAGHLDGAVNIDVQDAPGFAAAVGGLDPAATYVVYCRTGNRSAQAVARMTDLGFTVVDAGGLTAAAEATGLPVVTG